MDSAEPLFRDNLKVHFAGCEQYLHLRILTTAEVRYGLWTCYPFLAKKLGLPYYPQIPKVINDAYLFESIPASFKHSILDSGLYTLMFGAAAGKKDAAFIETWYEHLVEFVRENNVQSTCVEVDCQKVLGVDYAWRFRERMKNDLPNNRQINVFHIEDGREGLDRLIAFSNYIAISVPEWRIIQPKSYRHTVESLAKYIKLKKPKIDIHLLGCTEVPLLKRLKFCTSSDSTSWVLAGAFRRAPIGSKKIKNFIPAINANNDYLSPVVSHLYTLGVSPMSINAQESINAKVLNAVILKSLYSNAIGNQD